MNELKELRSLRAHFLSKPECEDPLAEYFRSEEFAAQLDALAKDPKALVQLTVYQLQHVALDPVAGSTVEEHLPGPEADGQYIVDLKLNRTINLVGAFTLPAEALEVEELKRAIAENLGSRKFKAAQAHRRLEARNIARFRRIAKVANEAVRAFQAAELQKAPPKTRFDEHRAFMKDLRERTKEVYESTYRPLFDRLTGRVRCVGRAAFDEGFDGAPTDALIEFAKRYIAPANPV